MAEPPAAADGMGRLAAAAKDAALLALLTFGLSVPIVAIETLQDISNQLVLRPRWALVGWLCAIAFVLRFVFSFTGEWPARVLLSAGGLLLLWGLWLEFAHAETSWWQRGWALLAGGLVGLGLVWRGDWTDRISGAVPAVPAGALRYFGPLAVALLLVYPWIALGLGGATGAVKWIDNFGIQILIYVMLGWGLNIVVGLAGLLDLGYVAFYAVGAYSSALLAKEFGLSFWLCLPLAGIMAAFWGILLGFPVLRLRGDYLAIVTLAFGEIIRLVLINWVDVTGGYAGISSIPRPSFFGLPFNAEEGGFAATFGLEPSPIYRTVFLFYLILALALLTNWVTIRLRRLPIGRAWEALREDEIACRALGIDTVTTKLTAFAIGAMFGGFAGAFFAARQGFISPESFVFMESAIILAIVVLGGMGSQVGVAIAAVAMIGGTEILRELDWLKAIFGRDFDPTQYRMLIFGTAMVAIMIWRPRGLISQREPSIFLKQSKAVSGSLVKEGHG